jgi:hypothetical protein
MPTAAVYCRVSTKDQEKEGSSLSSQRDYCRRKALDAGYELPESFIFSEIFSGADTARPKHLELYQPDISINVNRKKKGSASIILTAKAPALWAWLELEGADARFSDNFFHIRPGKPVEVTIFTKEPLSSAAIRKRLRVRSLIDTYQ